MKTFSSQIAVGSCLLLAALGAVGCGEDEGPTFARTLEERVCDGDEPGFVAASVPAESISFDLDCYVDSDALGQRGCETLELQIELADGSEISGSGFGELIHQVEFGYAPHEDSEPQVLLSIILGDLESPLDTGHEPMVWLTIPDSDYEPGVVAIGDLTDETREGCAFTNDCPALLVRAVADDHDEYQLGVPAGGELEITEAGRSGTATIALSGTNIPLAPATALYHEFLCDDGFIYYEPRPVE